MGFLERIKEDIRGAILVEFVITVPLFIMLLSMGMEFYDAYKSNMRAARAAHTLAKYTSVQQGVDSAHVDRMEALLNGLLPWLEGEKSLRLTAVRKTGSDYKVEYSIARGPDLVELIDNADVPAAIEIQLPPMLDGDQILFVETRVPHRPIFNMFDMADVVWTTGVSIYPNNICKEVRWNYHCPLVPAS